MVQLFETLWQDCFYAARTLRKNPAFTLMAVLTLALGIGASSTVFSALNTVVMEHEVESAAEFEALLARYGSDPQIREKAGAYLDFWETGKREVFRIV